MNLIQTLRRIGQQFKGTNNAVDMQSHQLKLIKKMYLKNGLELKLTCPAMPEQYEVFKDGKQVAYYRLRHGAFRVDYPECMEETIYEAQPMGDGIFCDNERLFYMNEAMKAVISKLNSLTLKQ